MFRIALGWYCSGFVVIQCGLVCFLLHSGEGGTRVDLVSSRVFLVLRSSGWFCICLKWLKGDLGGSEVVLVNSVAVWVGLDRFRCF